jgi:hypothetical protein
MRRILRADRERGAVAVEAAIVFPLLVVLTFGIIEFSLLLRDYVSVTSLVRSGVRTASTLPRDPNLFIATVQAMNRSGTALPQKSIDQLWIYKPDANGFPQGGPDFTSCGNDCIVYRVDPNTGDLVQTEDPTRDWDPMCINACPGDPAGDAVGVYVRANHDGITGLFFDQLPVSDFAVSKFEPIATYSATVQCKPAV